LVSIHLGVATGGSLDVTEAAVGSRPHNLVNTLIDGGLIHFIGFLYALLALIKTVFSFGSAAAALAPPLLVTTAFYCLSPHHPLSKRRRRRTKTATTTATTNQIKFKVAPKRTNGK
jgi:hypothetical protein